MFKLNIKDIINGLVVAILGAICAWFLQVASVPGFDFYTLQWGEVLRMALIAGVGYLAKKFLSTSDGSFGGVL